MQDDTRQPGGTALEQELKELLATAIDLHRRGNGAQAGTLYRAILSVDPQHADALHLLGALAAGSGDHSAACDLIARAIERNPRAPQFHFNLGVSLQALQRHADAAGAYARALELRPQWREALENLGVALQDAGELEAAAAAYEGALALDPSSSLAHQNLGTLLGNLGRTDQAREHFGRVLDCHPLYGDARMKRGWTLLLDGRFAEGWRDYEWRDHASTFVANNPPRNVPFPQWDGSSLADKTILVTPEQGIGDEIMFASCYRELIRAARHCVLECDPRLVPAFARSYPSATVLAADRRAPFAWSSGLPPIDCYVRAGSLPSFRRTSLDDFPAQTAHLAADPRMREQWAARLRSLRKPLTVGISWRGGREPRSSGARSIPLADWRPIVSFPGAAFVNLQYGDTGAERAAVERELGVAINHFSEIDPLAELENFFALVAALDLVISIDNSTVFVAGALGTPVWILLPAHGEWRWLRERATSPWYASAELFRQRRPGPGYWPEVVESVAARLAAASARPRDAEPPAAKLRGGAAPRVEALRGGAEQASAAPHAPRRRADGVSGIGGTAVLVNDTAHWYHFGCTCTSLALHAALRERHSAVRSLPIQTIARLTALPSSAAAFDDAEQLERFRAANPGVVELLESADAVYVNGEGSLHGLSSSAVALLYLMHVAKARLGRPVHLINHSCYPDDRAEPADASAVALYQNVYERLDRVAVREAVSARLVARMGIAATQSFDCLPLFVERQFAFGAMAERRRRVLIAGSASFGGKDVIGELAVYVERLHSAGYETGLLVGARAYLAADDVAFVEALKSRCGAALQLVTPSCELDWLRAIADAALLVSGRFHHTIAAAFLDTPFIVMESNTPKIAGLLEMLRSESFVSVHDRGLAAVLDARTRDTLADPRGARVADDVKAELRALARRNFR